MTTPKQTTYANQLKRTIKTGMNVLGMDDGTYRMMLLRVSQATSGRPKNSITLMSIDELKAVVEDMREHGFEPQHRKALGAGQARGMTASLDAWLAHDGARDAILATAKLSGELGVVTIRYVGLFRPEKTELTFARVAKLINELLPPIQSGRLEFDGKLFDAPIEAWLYSMNEMLRLREQGKLKLPLTNHHYLYRVVSAYKAPTITALNTPVSTPSNKMEEGVKALQGLKR